MMKSLIIEPHPRPLSKARLPDGQGEGRPGFFALNSKCLLLLLILISSICAYSQKQPSRTDTHTQFIPILTFDSFKKYLQPAGDTVYVINFWATWCKPCVDELPAFEKLNETYKNQKVKVLLVSLDFKSQYDKKVVPFVKKNKLNSEVIMLDTQGDNSFIDKVSPQWQGTIPATTFVHSSTNTKKFFEKQFSYEQLENIVKPLIKM